MADRYNGWKNYETWTVSLWLGNEQGTDTYWREVAREVYENAQPRHVLTREEVAHIDLAGRVKDEIEENHLCPDGGLYADLLNAALSEVDWHEVAAFYLDDIVEGDSEEPLG